MQTVGLADGEWYGTGTWSRYYPTKGPDIVKVTVKNGVINEVVSVVYTDDENPVYAAGKKIMERAKGKTDLSELKKQLDDRTGADFDAVSGATETAKGHLTAMENALARSRTYAANKQDQKIAWMEFKTKPATSAKLGSNLDLSKTEIRLHLTNGETKVELYDSKTDKLIQTVKIPGTEWKKVKGCLMLRDVELPGEYKSWKVDDFKIKVYDADDRELMSSLYTAKLDYYKEALEIDFPQYKEYYTEGGYLKFYFKIGEVSDTPKAEETEKEKEKEKEETSKTAEGTARVKIMGISESSFDYDVKVKVTYNEESGEIISVSDNKTDAGSANAEYWKKIQTIFEKFNGKKLEELDTIDAVSGATYSSQAIKEAVKKAISSKGDEVDAPKVRAADHRTHLIYTAGPAVLHVDSPKEAQIYYTTDGSDPREENNGKKN